MKTSPALLSFAELPRRFSYPPQFLRAAKLGVVNLEPWYLPDAELLQATLDGLRERYRSRVLVPFARRQDNDDIACFVPNGHNYEVAIIHDFASPGWEQHETFPDFWAWFRCAVEDFIEFEP